MTGRSSSDDAPRVRRTLTPEQRRILGQGRSAPTQQPAPVDRVEDARLAAAPTQAAPSPRERSGALEAQVQASRALELRHAILVLGALLLLGAIFYAGRRYEYLKYLIITHTRGQQLDNIQDKYPRASPEELVETGLAAEKRGDWSEAVERLLSAKRKNLALPGILYFIGKGSFDRGDLVNADAALSQAIRLGENLPGANFYRGIIATRRNDLPAALRSFEAAAAADPFLSDLYYYWGEALRLDFKPRDAIKRYQQAILRARSPEETALCEFKIRMARIEAAETNSVTAELEQARAAGPLNPDWIMADAALRLRDQRIAEAAQLISEARATGNITLFLTTAADPFFQRAAIAHQEIADALRSTAAGH